MIEATMKKLSRSASPLMSPAAVQKWVMRVLIGSGSPRTYTPERQERDAGHGRLLAM